MNPTSTSPTPRRRPISTAGEWPLLAQLPDVSSQDSIQTNQSKQLAPTAATGYGIDTPKVEVGPPRNPDAPREYQESTVASAQLEENRSRPLPQPHRLQRTWRVDQASLAFGRTSPALPSSNPFAIPSTSLHDAIAPMVRFALLFVLFTAAGTTILMAGRANRAKSPVAPPAAAATTGPLLEPTSVIESLPTAIEPPSSPTTASSRAGNDPAQQADRLTGALPSFPDMLPPANEDAWQSHETTSERVTSDPASSAPIPAASAPETSWWPLTGEGRALPQVRTSEPPAAVANLPGYILESPSRQASNDDQQSVY